METTLRPAKSSDLEFSFTAKHQALGPHIAKRWGWDDAFQREFHRKRWVGRPWSIIMLGERPIGTVSVEETESHIRFGEFYLLPAHQGQGIGTKVLQSVLKHADAQALPVKLEYLKWNPVGSLYKRHGFVVVDENEIHYFLVRHPIFVKPRDASSESLQP